MDQSSSEMKAKQAAEARREGRLQDARRDILDAIELIRNSDSPDPLIRALMFAGQVERDEAKPTAALPFYIEAVELARETAAPLRRAHTVRHLADLYVELDELDLAEACFHESLSIYRDHEDSSVGDFANAIRGYAVLQDAAGNSDEAQLLWIEARDFYQSIGLEEGVVECNQRIQKYD